MDALDLNLLLALDALLDTHSVTESARRLHTSTSAMSRTLTRLRTVLGDPLLVRSGRQLVPTPRALELRHDVAALVDQARLLLTARDATGAGRTREFVVRATDSVSARLSGPLLAAVRAQLPGVTVRLLAADPADTAVALRDGRVDVEVGMLGQTDPETVVTRLFADRWVGLAAADHPFGTDRPTVAAYASAPHLEVSATGRTHSPIDDRLALHGRTRRVVATVPDLSTALFTVATTDLVCPAPELLSRPARAALGLTMFEIPLPLPAPVVAMAWHPRNSADAGHRALRDLIADVLRDTPRPELVPVAAPA
ncbi:LysR family transcriptional regulator [Nocardia asteroides NBRC 15531]|uniref:LysR family transcriptional regulator n=1 Tax=Nocardia asteroides NBRC 15531 TaxID=1110697 RepID=U5EDM9_NOCAS|nr:LysR family transcriptional regulator [Nocardia asteroides]TLF64432.1 LysR family transcriptional regulator [Nocardia asteroides NBRC 15531]UGT50455.1 LysR family transcriptional regulator [Nocardia asteroides]SFN08137.1 transcriptional regulator, LysR family [Nocardia asteroides]VEG36742.1 Symbiotic regulator homolog 1 [Nocardia asteroides]GAD84516.1 putative LysR family transcriptional regulator [Nocardia asteroides NBRC 15531]